MAKIVFGFGSSHGPLLATPPERWDLRAADDRKNPEHPFRGRIYNFPDLVEARKGEKDFEKESSLEVRTERYQRNNRAMDRLVEKVEEVNPDIIVVVGDDQHEWFYEDVQPTFTVYCGEQVINTAIDQEKMKTKSPGIAAFYVGPPSAAGPGLSRAGRPRPCGDRAGDRRRIRCRDLGEAAGERKGADRHRPCGRLHLSPHRQGPAGAGAADPAQHLFSAQPSDREALLRVRPFPSAAPSRTGTARMRTSGWRSAPRAASAISSSTRSSTGAC